MCASVIRSNIFRNRKIFQAWQGVIFSFQCHTAKLIMPQFGLGIWDLKNRNIHSEKFFGDKKEWVVTHLAEEEIALTALRRLELTVNKFKRVKKSDIQLVLKGNLNYIFADKKDVIFLIRCCGFALSNERLEIRRMLAKTVWDKLCNCSIQLKNEHFTALLKTNLENHSPICPKQFLLEMKALGVDPNGKTLRMLLLCVNEVDRDEENLDFVTEKLKSMGFSAGSESNGTLASVLAEQGNILGAEDIVESMRKRQVSIANSVYASLIKGYVIQGEKEQVLQLLADMERMGVKLLPLEYASIASKLAEVSCYPQNKSKQLIESVMAHLGLPQREGTHHCVANAIVELLHCGKGDAACQLLQSLPPSLQFGGEFDEPLPLVFCKELVRADFAPEEVLQICIQLEDWMVALLEEEGSLKSYALRTVTGYALQSAKTEVCLFLLEALAKRGGLPLRPHYFWPLLLATAKQESEERQEGGLLKLLKKMASLGVAADCETLAVYVLPFTHMQQRSNAFEALTFLKQSGARGVMCRTAVTQWLLDEGRLAEAATFNEIHRGQIEPSPLVEPLISCIISKIEQPGDSALLSLAKLLNSMKKKHASNIDYTGHFLLELAEKLSLFEDNGMLSEGETKAINYLLRVLKVLDAKSVRISQEAWEYLLNALGPRLEWSEQDRPLPMLPIDDRLLLPLSEFHPIIPHPRDMGVDELEAHLTELRAKGFNERGVLRRLLQLHSRKKNIKRALELMRDLELSNHSFSPGMLSSLLDLFTHSNELEKAEDVFRQLKSDYPKFKLDDYKVIDLAALMCRRDRVNEGITLLQGHAEGVKVRPGPSIERNLVNLILCVIGSHKEANVGVRRKAGGDGKINWTPAALVDELVRLGYMVHPLSASMKAKVKEMSG